MKKNTLCLALLLTLPLILLAAPEDPGFGIYIAPMLGSGHFGVSATNMPIFIDRTPNTVVTSVNPSMTEATRGSSFGGKLGFFYRPDNYDRRHRFDLEAQCDFFSNQFHFGNEETDILGNTVEGFESWTMNGIGIVGRMRWSVELDDRWQPYVHMGYGVNLLSLGEADGVGHGFNVGAGMRVRLCSKYAFYLEYETSPMQPVNLAYSDLGKNLGTIQNTIGIPPGFSQVTVAFELPISFCLDCGKGRY
jgi:opacity protein-like surface antigen